MPGPSVEDWALWSRSAASLRYRLRAVCLECAQRDSAAALGRLRALCAD